MGEELPQLVAWVALLVKSTFSHLLGEGQLVWCDHFTNKFALKYKNRQNPTVLKRCCIGQINCVHDQNPSFVS